MPCKHCSAKAKRLVCFTRKSKTSTIWVAQKKINSIPVRHFKITSTSQYKCLKSQYKHFKIMSIFDSTTLTEEPLSFKWKSRFIEQFCSLSINIIVTDVLYAYIEQSHIVLWFSWKINEKIYFLKIFPHPWHLMNALDYYG